MKNYVIINGVNSLTITGLAISKLPSISKPPLRVMTEEINGRDGDLITELGYGAYDKELVVGLYGNYDINEVIGFFNQEGTIVFSNEDDKYYNFKIINQIDYEALIKFRTATISLHCQPFKYPLTETPEEITTEYVEDEGETLTLNDTKIAPLEIDLKGNTTQNGTPTPSSPIDVNVVSGDNEVVVCGKNLLPISTLATQTKNGMTFTNNNDGSYTFNGTTSAYSSFVMFTDLNFNGNYTYVLKDTATTGFEMYLQNSGGSGIGNATTHTTKNGNVSKIIIGVQPNITLNNLVITPYVYSGNYDSSFTYEPYTSQNYPLYLGVENLFGVQDNTITTQGITITTANNNVSFVGTATRSYVNTTTIPINLPMGTYTISATNTNYNFYVWFKDNNNAEVGATSLYKQPRTITLTGNATKIQYGVESLTTGNSYNIQTNFQIETGSKANSYTPYGTTPIELNNIGNYVDFPFKAINGDKYYDTLTQAQKDLLTYGKWYLHKEVGKTIWNSTTGSAGGGTFDTMKTNGYICRYNDNVSLFPAIITNNKSLVYCNRLKGTNNSLWNGANGEGISLSSSVSAVYLCISFSTIENYYGETLTSSNYATAFNSYLANNETIIYYPLATPTDTEITNTTLINQLENLKGAMSYEGQTNISQVNNDLPFILKVKGIKEGSGEGIINNIGNIYAKPIIALEGTGNIGIYKNGTQYFEVDMSNDSKITIDTENMEAYHNGVLKNRQVIGDYNKFTIDEGNNNIEITGELTKATITKYTRYL